MAINNKVCSAAQCTYNKHFGDRAAVLFIQNSLSLELSQQIYVLIISVEIIQMSPRFLTW